MSPEMIAIRVILAIGVITALSQLLGILFKRVGQPAVIGQIAAGIALGPSLLGRLTDNHTNVLVPTTVLPALTVVAQLALVIFLFSVGYEFDLKLLHDRVRPVLLVSGAAFVIPMLLGLGTAVLVEHLFGDHMTRTTRPAFLIFMAVALSITAVPVLAAIVREHRLTRTVAGVIAMVSASIIDGLGWLALSVALIAAGASTDQPLPLRIALLIGYVLAMTLVIRPLLRAWMGRGTSAMEERLPLLMVLVMGSAWFTGFIGLHVILGAFLAGLILPRRADGEPHPELLAPFQKVGTVLIPAFFAVSGLSINLTAMRLSDLWLLLLLCAIATCGKLGGGLLAARMARLTWRDSTMIGVLLNTRGLTELIALNVGLQAGIIGPRLYTDIVLMALLTTAATGPLLLLVRRVLPDCPLPLPADLAEPKKVAGRRN